MDKKTMITCNKDATRQIKACEAHLIHVLLQRVDYHPTKPEIHSTVERVSSFPVEDFERMEAMNQPGHSRAGVGYTMNWVRVAGWQTGKVIHDGRLIPQEQKDEILKFWAELLRPKVSPVEELAGEIKSMKRKLNINRGGF